MRSMLVTTMIFSLGACGVDDPRSTVQVVEDGANVSFTNASATVSSGGTVVSFLAQNDSDESSRRALKISTVPEVGTHRCAEELIDETIGYVVNVRYLKGAGSVYGAHAEGTSCEINILEKPDSEGGTWRLTFEAVLSRPGDVFNRIVLDRGEIEAIEQ